MKDVRERLVDGKEEGRQAGDGEAELDEDDVEDLEDILNSPMLVWGKESSEMHKRTLRIAAMRPARTSGFGGWPPLGLPLSSSMPSLAALSESRSCWTRATTSSSLALPESAAASVVL